MEPQPNSRSNRKHTRLATWNVRTLGSSEKMNKVVAEMQRLNLSILGMCEVRWIGKGKKSVEGVEGFTIIYSGGSSKLYGVGMILNEEISKCYLEYSAFSDRVLLVKLKGNPFNVSIIQAYAPTSTSSRATIEDFYRNLNQAYHQCSSQEIKIVMGDMNAKVGEGKVANIVGPFGLGDRNERGDMFVDWCVRNRQVITNTWFKHHSRFLYTWICPGDRCRNQIDFVTINERFRNSIKDARTYHPGADCKSDHKPVVVTMQLRLRKRIVGRMKETRIQYKDLENENIRVKFKTKVTRMIGSEIPNGQLWEVMKTALQQAAEEHISRKESTKANKEWMTEEILALMEERAGIDRRTERYESLKREIRLKCNKAKATWLGNECREMQVQNFTNFSEFCARVRKLSGKKKGARSGRILSEDGCVLTEHAEMCQRWEGYVTELVHDSRESLTDIVEDMEGPNILKSEIRAATGKVKKGKAVGPDDVSVEMIAAMGDEGIDLLYKIFNHIYDTGELPGDFLHTLLIASPKKPGAVKCKDHRIISIMSHSAEILLNIILERIQNKLCREISDEEFGVVCDKGRTTTNAIFTLRMLCERAIKHQQNVFLCFLDYDDAFDKVRHRRLLQLLGGIGADSKDRRLIENFCWNQTAVVQVDNERSGRIDILRGLRQGCVLAPGFFNLFSDVTLRIITDIGGIKVNDVRLNNIRYFDKITLIATSQEELQKLLDNVVRESEREGMWINYGKTKSMVISKSVKEKPRCKLITGIGNEQIEEVRRFEYLGSVISEDAKCLREVNTRIAIAKQKFQDMHSIFANRHITWKLRIRLLKCCIWRVLMYACESWTLTEDVEERINVAAGWLFKNLRIPEGKEAARAKVEEGLLLAVIKRQLRFLGHVIRKDELEYKVLQGRIDGKVSRGRPRRTYMKEVERITGISKTASILESARDTQIWEEMITQRLKKRNNNVLK